MSKENVDLVREVFDTFNGEGVGALVVGDLLDPDLEAHPFPDWMGPSLYRGAEGFVTLVEEWTDNFNDYRWDVRRLLDAGEEVLVFAYHQGRTKDHDVAVDARVSAVFRVKDRKVLRMAYFHTWDEALEAAGLRE